MVTLTQAKIANVEDLVTFHDDFTAEEVAEILSSAYPYLSSYSFSEVVAGNTRTIIFSEKMGTKGSSN